MSPPSVLPDISPLRDLLRDYWNMIHSGLLLEGVVMAVRRTGQMSLAEAFIGGSVGGRSEVLDRISGLVKWYRFEKLLSGFNHDGPGEPGWPALVLYKALLLQSLYGLSDRELEEALADRLSFQRFAGLGLAEGVPDHTVINRFRNALVERGLLDRLFGELDRQLEKAGVVLKRGAMLDATLIEASSAPGSAERGSRDGDARFGGARGKGGGFTFGYKAHVGVDLGSGLIRAVATTPANVNDTQMADQLIRGDEREVYADAAYDTHARRARLKAAGVKTRIARRPNKHHPLPGRLKRYNRLIARRRAAVETTFATWKNRMRLTRIRYVGLAKAAAQITMAALAFNLRRWAALTP
jgi:transposase, IS5 family